VSRAFTAVLQAPVEVIHNEAFNLGANHLNHQIIELAQIAVRTVPGSTLEVLARPGADQRTYRTDFSKFARTFPGFQFNWDADTGAKELYESFKKNGLTYETFTDPKFTRLKWLRHLLDTGQLDDGLRWQTAQKEAIS
jgi:hypothetical protein